MGEKLIRSTFHLNITPLHYISYYILYIFLLYFIHIHAYISYLIALNWGKIFHSTDRMLL